MKDKKELVYDLAGALVAILFGCIVVIMIIVNIPGTKEIDGALIASVLTGGVTLFAPIAAYYLLSNWKEQHNANIETDYKKEIIQAIRKIQPVERKYGRLLTNYLLYNANPMYALPIEIDIDEVKEFLKNIDHLLNLMTEYYEFNQDEDIKNKREYYLNYAQYYSAILYNINNITQSEDTTTGKEQKILDVLNVDMRFKFRDDGKEWDGSTKFGYALEGLQKTGLTRFIVSKLRL